MPLLQDRSTSALNFLRHLVEACTCVRMIPPAYTVTGIQCTYIHFQGTTFHGFDGSKGHTQIFTSKICCIIIQLECCFHCHIYSVCECNYRLRMFGCKLTFNQPHHQCVPTLPSKKAVQCAKAGNFQKDNQ